VGTFIVHTTIPPNTPQSAPIEVSIEPPNRIVTRCEVQFPMNTAMLAGIQLLDRGGRFWPAPGSPSEWITGDDNVVVSDSSYILSGVPSRIAARMYNEDNTFDRTPEIRIEVQDTSLQLLLQEFVSTIGEALRRLAGK
jgi:hypothetical protein